MKLLDRIFNKHPKLVVVEVEPLRRLPELDADSRRSVLALADHPGFRYIVAKLKFEQTAVQSRFNRERQTDLADVAYLQSGIYWMGWLDDFIRKETASAERKYLDSTEAERLAFEESLKAYEEIG